MSQPGFSFMFQMNLRNLLRWPFLLYFLSLVWFGVSTSFKNGADHILSLKLNNIKKEGRVFVSVSTDDQQWPSQGKYGYTLDATSTGTVYFKLENVPFGRVAIALFMDLNSNGKLDTNFFGAPSEPYAFSNNIVPRFSAPKFKECSFLFLSSGQEISINVNPPPF